MKKKCNKLIIGIVALSIVSVLGVGAYYTLSAFSAHFYRITNSITALNDTISNTDVVTVAPPEPEKLTDSLSDNSINIYIGEHLYKIDCAYTEQAITLVEVAKGKEYPVIFNEYSDVIIYIDGEQVNNGDSVSFDNINRSETTELIISDGQSQRVYSIKTLPNIFPDLSISGSYQSDKEIFASFFTPYNFILQMDFKGEINYVKQSPYSMMDFAKWEFDENIYYTYFQEAIDYDNLDLGGTLTKGNYVVMDEDYNNIDTIELVESEKYIFTEDMLEGHDMIMLAPEHYLTMAYVVQIPKFEHANDIVESNTRVYAAYIQEVQNGEIIWEWISSDYEKFYYTSVDGNDYISQVSVPIADYMHINSIDIDEKDNNIIVSSRNQDSVFKINRQTNEIEWVLGGIGDEFLLTDEQKFSRQHDASYINENTILLFDNGNNNGLTQILKFEIDEKNKTVLSYEEFSMNTFSGACGSVQDLGGDIYCIGWGIKGDRFNEVMSIVDFNTGEVLTELFSDYTALASYRIRVY